MRKFLQYLVFKVLLLARQIKNLHETKNTSKNVSINVLFFFNFLKCLSNLVRRLRRFSQNSVFEAVLFARQLKNPHKTKNGFQKCFLNIFIRKNTESTFSRKMSIFGQKSGGHQQLSGNFRIFFIRFRNHRYQGKFVPNLIR